MPIVRARSHRSVVSGLSISRDPSTIGAYVLDVESGSVAENIEMTPGDVVMAVGDQMVTDAESYYAAMSRYAPGALVRLTVRGTERARYVTTTVGNSDYYPNAPPDIICAD